MRVILASASPRRRELLAQIVPEFEVVPADVDEAVLSDESPQQTAERLAITKGRAVLAVHSDALVIAGDTVVAVGELQLAKPADPADAERMLRLLSGREHVVITALCVTAPGNERVVSDVTRVRFRQLSDEEIRAYVATGEPMDKAGGYAIQGGAKDFVEWIDGSWSNVVGLPLEKLEPILRELLDAKRL